MKILVVGGGGREHAIIKKLSESPRKPELYAAPGNGGIASLAVCLPYAATDIDGIIKAVREYAIDLVFVAPDDPLMLGMVDRLNEVGIRAFGPLSCAAIIEGSKVFSKNLMKKYGIPTADYEIFTETEKAVLYLSEYKKYPVVIKADGLALGKGAVIVNDAKEAIKTVKEIMEDGIFGAAGKSVVIEEFLTGTEVTVLSFTDGKTLKTMVSSQDHKRVNDNDEGLNTGGMGAFAPSAFYTPERERLCMEKVFIPTVEAMKKEGRTFRGVIYFQLMFTKTGPYVIEYNARFGDPETQVVLPLLKTDLLDIIDAVIDGELDKIDIEWKNEAAVCVVAASGGYPVKYEKGYPISGLESFRSSENVYVYHAGTKLVDGQYLTNGGRVLGVTALGADVRTAAAAAYEAIEKISFEKMHYRHDIGKKNG